MTVYLRPFDADTDTTRLAELLAAARGSRQAAEGERRTRLRAVPQGRLRYRVVAVETGERLVSYGEVGRDAWMRQGDYWMDLLVAAEVRCQGAGSMLYDDLLQFAWEQGAKRILAHSTHWDAAAVRFAAARGFCVGAHVATLCLCEFGAADYDPAAPSDLPEVRLELDLAYAIP